MKRIISLLLAVMTVFALAACGGKTTTVDAQSLAKALVEKTAFESELSAVSTAEEVFVVECYDAAAASALRTSMQDFLNSQKTEMERYLPAEVERINGAVFETYGTCVVLCVTSDADTARGIIKEYVK